MDAKRQGLAPCGVSDFVCGRGSEWISNGTELCCAAGFSVEPSDDTEETSCYGGKASLDSIVDSWRALQSGVPQKAESSVVWEDFQQWVRVVPFSEKFVGQWEEWSLLQVFSLQSWLPIFSFCVLAVAYSVIHLSKPVGACSKRKSHGQQQKRAVIQHTARRLDSQTSQKSPVTQGIGRELEHERHL